MTNKKQQSVTVSDTWNFSDSNIQYTNEIIKWINEKVVRQISLANNEPDWMLELRLKALEIFRKKELPKWW